VKKINFVLGWMDRDFPSYDPSLLRKFFVKMNFVLGELRGGVSFGGQSSFMKFS
jgi:hypothetical protein